MNKEIYTFGGIITFKKAFDILKQKKMKQRIIQAAWVCYLAQEEIEREFGQKEIMVISFQNGAINLAVGSSILAGEVRLKAEELKNKINQKLKKDLVERIRTRIK